MTFSEKLKAYRKTHDLTQEDLAKTCHVSRQTITKWETTDAKPDTETLKQLSVLMSMNIDDLLDGSLKYNPSLLTVFTSIKTLIILNIMMSVITLIITIFFNIDWLHFLTVPVTIALLITPLTSLYLYAYHTGNVKLLTNHKPDKHYDILTFKAMIITTLFQLLLLSLSLNMLYVLNLFESHFQNHTYNLGLLAAYFFGLTLIAIITPKRFNLINTKKRPY